MDALVLSLAPDWAVRHAAALIVALPMILAPIAVVFSSERLSWFLSIVASVASTLFALILLAQVRDGGVVSYALGGWEPPFGIEFRIDSLNALILLLVSAVGVLAVIFSRPTVTAEIRQEKRAYFYAAYMVCFCGLLGVAATGDAFNLFVFLEISSIATYVLVALGARRDRRALPAAFSYLIMGTIGASFYVIGVGFLYAATGTLNMADIATRLPELGDSRTVQAGFAFIVVGLGLKAAMWPLHQWLPGAYAHAPSFVTVFLSATATKVAIYALARFVFSVFSFDFAMDSAGFVYLLAPLSLAAMVACSFQAIFQSDIRRMLAYSSVAQVGYILLGVALGTALGLSAGLLHLINHALMKGALFMAVAALVLTYQGARLNDFEGAARGAPLTMTAFGIAALSLIGVPLTAGFQSKIALLNAVLAEGWWWAAMIIVFSSLLAVVYMGRVLEAVFFKPPANPTKARKEAPAAILVPLWILAIANIWIGFDASVPATLANEAAAAVIGSGSAR
ncbi:MAG: monovalent cation/H+ antiporter subunit D family protein [Pseudomonadota bacterium]